MFGGEEVFDQAEGLGLDGPARETLEYPRSLYMSLKKLGLGGRLMVDLGLVQRNDYYTGVVFSGYVHEQGGAVLTGGRYDGLCGRFGPEMPAAGFAMDLDAAAQLLLPQLPPEEPAQVLVHGEPGFETEAQQALLRLTGQGVPCEGSVWESLEEAIQYAARGGIPRVLRVGQSTEEIVVERGARV